jgi:NADPH:quinone reductase-like Zn-dependent oxidoreductase
MAEILDLYEIGAVRPEVTARYPLEDFAIALARFADHDVTGKLVLTTGAGSRPGPGAAIA